MPYKFNIFTGNLDIVKADDLSEDKELFVLKAGDTMTGDLVLSNSKIFIGNAQTYFSLSGNDLSLYVNNTLRQMWTTTATTAAPGVLSGQPIGMLLGLTYS